MTEKDESVKDEILEISDKDLEGTRSKFLVFDLVDENYGVPLSSVKEVIGLTEITKVPNVPEFFKGLINLRGKIISVIDLRNKLKLPSTDYKDKKTTIIIAEIDDFTIGTVVDDVREVANFDMGQIEHGLDIQSKVGREFIKGVAKTEGRKLTLLLDMGKVLSVEEMCLLRNQAQQKAA